MVFGETAFIPGEVVVRSQIRVDRALSNMKPSKPRLASPW